MAFPAAALIGALAPVVKTAMRSLFPDKEEADKRAAELTLEMSKIDSATVSKAFDVIIAEAQSESWLTRTWRPLTMLWMMGLLTMWMFGYTPANVEAYIPEFFALLKLGIGGYVVTRGGQKMIAAYKGEPRPRADE